MADPWRGITATAVLLATAGIGKPQPPSADPSRGFDPNAAGERQTIAARNVQPLQQHGNSRGGVDHGPTNAGIIFGARVYGDNLVKAIELFYYIPSNADRLYRAGDYRGSTGPIGDNHAGDLGGFYCPAGYAAIGLQGASGLGVDRVGLICGKIGDLSRAIELPVLGGRGGNSFKETCDRSYSTGYLTGVRIRSGMWMDSIQGLCQTRE